MDILHFIRLIDSVNSPSPLSKQLIDKHRGASSTGVFQFHLMYHIALQCADMKICVFGGPEDTYIPLLATHFKLKDVTYVFRDPSQTTLGAISYSELDPNEHFDVYIITYNAQHRKVCNHLLDKKNAIVFIDDWRTLHGHYTRVPNVYRRELVNEWPTRNGGRFCRDTWWNHMMVMILKTS